MATFTVRVELHNNPSSRDYDNLHGYMEASGFIRTITSGDGLAFHLPPGEYNFRGDFTSDSVCDKAFLAASRTGKNNAILVTESNDRTWRGLTQVGMTSPTY